MFYSKTHQDEILKATDLLWTRLFFYVIQHTKKAGNSYIKCIYLFSNTSFVSQAVRLESVRSDRVRYMVVIYTNGHQGTEEDIVLGMDFADKDRYNICSYAFCILLVKCCFDFLK